MAKNVSRILSTAVSPYDEYCTGFGMLPESTYITTPLIATGVADIECAHGGSDILDKIVSFDRAEGEYANITQTNMVTVSSFNGINGAILGYDFLKQNIRPYHLVDPEKYPNVYDAEPLFKATQALYGTIKEKHFPIAPGQHILCAYKSLYKNGPCMMYGALAIAIAKDREHNADLYMEDHGTVLATHSREANLEQQTTIIESLLLSVKRISENLNVEYEKIFIGFKCKNVQSGQVGCVITAAPYIHLAKNAIPKGDIPALEHMSLSDWQSQVSGSYMNQPA
ncbi:MAG: histidine decarboxylase, pyruvoyl type [bacterium]